MFEAVLAEALDRVSHDQADVAVLYRNLRFAGFGIFTLAEGEISGATGVRPLSLTSF